MAICFHPLEIYYTTQGAAMTHDEKAELERLAHLFKGLVELLEITIEQIKGKD